MATLAHRIAAFTAPLTWADLPAPLQAKSRASLLHNLGGALAAGPLTAAAVRYASVLDESGRGAPARLLISGRAAAPDTAALVNSALMHARAQDDIYLSNLTHAGSATTGAALALAEARRLPGRALLTAIIAGYEAVGALSENFAPRAAARGLRPSACFAVFGAAVAAAHVLRLDVNTSADAITLAASLACGPAQPWQAGSPEWRLQTGFAARNGIMAARLAAAGLKGAPDALEGDAGFYRAICGSADGADQAAQDLGSTWRALTLTYERFPVSALLQMPVAQAVATAREHELTPPDVRAFRLYLPPTEAALPGVDSRGPFRGVSDKLISAQFGLALALARRRVVREDAEHSEDAELQSLIASGSVIAAPALQTGRFVLEIDTTQGRTLRRPAPTAHDYCATSGAQVAASMRALCDEHGLDPDQFERLIEVVLSAQSRPVYEIVSACVAATARAR